MSPTASCCGGDDSEQQDSTAAIHAHTLPEPPTGTLPPGAVVIPDFVSISDEQALLTSLHQTLDDPNASTQWQQLKRRRVAHFGHVFNYSTRSYDDFHSNTHPLPPFTHAILSEISTAVSNSYQSLFQLHQSFDDHEDTRVYQQCSNRSPPFNQLTVNEYLCGVGLRAHVDTHSAFAGPIVSLSLGSGCVFEFRRAAKKSRRAQGQSYHSVYLPRRSLLILSTEARYQWMHFIPLRKYDLDPSSVLHRRNTRTSFTFRCVRESRQCQCHSPLYCDTFQQSNSDSSRPATQGMSAHESVKQELVEVASRMNAIEMEREYVRRVYSAIAPHFDDTRFAMWPKVRRFASTLSAHSVVVDIGCGNGSALKLAPQCLVYAVDADQSLLNYAKAGIESAQSCFDGRVEFGVGDCMSLPLRDSSVDGVICVAVLHHICSRERRMAAMREIVRVMKPHARAMLYVWASTQKPEHKTIAKWFPLHNTVSAEWCSDGDYLVPWYVHVGLNEDWQQRALELGGVYDETHRGVRLLRYCHLFSGDELRELVLSQPCPVEILGLHYEKNNWCIEFQKTEP